MSEPYPLPPTPSVSAADWKALEEAKGYWSERYPGLYELMSVPVLREGAIPGYTLCSIRWKAGRSMTNTSGEEFYTMPVEHVCGLPAGHDQPTSEDDDESCRCACGARIDDDDV